MVTFISKAYTGRTTDKEITLDSGYLDKVPRHSTMFDKEFLLHQECAARQITPYMPPGKRGTSQMTTLQVSKTKRIANLRIIVEQVIRRMKTFRILQHELPISLIPHVDDLLVMCSSAKHEKTNNKVGVSVEIQQCKT